MWRRFITFGTTVMLGYALVVLLLAGGMILTARRFDVVASGHVNRIRVEEDQITEVERLRWSGEAIVSTGRGYLISGDSVFLARLEEAQANFDREIDTLTSGASDAKTTALVTDVEGDAILFRRHQERLVDSTRTEDLHALAIRFEAELVPLQRELVASLDRLIQYKEAGIDAVYQHVAGERARLRTSLNALLAGLVLVSLAIAAYIATLMGRSHRKEQQALQTSRAATAARDEIMGVVAHDLRNPLASIVMRAGLLQESSACEATTKHAHAIEVVSLRMESLIGSMLDVATIESGHLVVRPEPCPVDDLIDETIEMFRDLAAPKQIRLERGPVRERVIVLADRERVLQVLANLVGNAIKFTHHGGRVVIATENEPQAVRVRVSDSGPGIAKDHVPHVFDRFWKHDARGTRGTGLGLFISKGIIDAHGGRIWVESGPGHGATFYFTLPLGAAVTQRAVPPSRVVEPRQRA